jgi:RNA polymerase sigma-70 factor (ECF subfamily)
MKQYEFTALYREYSRPLYNFIRWTTGYSAMSDDITQNMFIKVLRSENAPSDPVEIRRWLYAIARNACIDYFRSNARLTNFKNNYATECAVNGSIEVEDTNESEEIWKQLTKLPDVDRSILYLHLKEGYAYKEIADTLEMNENQVRVKAFRALRKLRDEMCREEV